MFNVRIDFKINLTDSNSIRKCVQSKIDVAVLVVRGGLHGGGGGGEREGGEAGFWMVNT